MLSTEVLLIAVAPSVARPQEVSEHLQTSHTAPAKCPQHLRFHKNRRVCVFFRMTFSFDESSDSSNKFSFA